MHISFMQLVVCVLFTFGSPRGPAGVDDERSIMLLGSFGTGQPIQCQLRSSVLLHVGICRQHRMQTQSSLHQDKLLTWAANQALLDTDSAI